MWTGTGSPSHRSSSHKRIKTSGLAGGFDAACQKSHFDKLRAVFQNFLSSEKPVIANERHP